MDSPLRDMKISEFVYQGRLGSSRSQRMTMQELADKAGLSKSYICKIEAGEMDDNNISLNTFLSLCEAFNKNPAEIISSLNK